MEIYSYICTKTHYTKKNFSISCIYDVKHNLYYFLKGISSNLWYKLVKDNDFDKLRLFAENNNITKELNSLLFELKEKEIIKTDKAFEDSNYNYLSKSISRKSDNLYHFLDKWSEAAISIGCIDALILELTYKCNLKCRHCYNHKDMNEYYISFEDAKKIIDQAIELGIGCVRLTGGECTLNKDFIKICEYIRSKRLELCVYTNGQILNDNEELFEKFINLYPSLIQCSIYSMDADIHDSITGVKGSLEKTMNLINKVKKTSTLVDIATFIASYNKDSYKEIQKYADSIGATYRDTCLFTNNPENNNLNSKITFEEMKKFYSEKYINFDVQPHFIKNEYSVCEAGYDRLCVTPKLDVLPCVAVDYVLGNMNSTSLKKIKETTLKNFQKMFIRNNLSECFNEEYCAYCHYCPDSLSLENSSIMKKHPLLCENAKAFYEALVSTKAEKE